MTQDHSQTPASSDKPADAAPFEAAVGHLDQSIRTGSIAESAAQGILYSLIETLGALVGDPDLPEHARSGYQAVLEAARELRATLGK
jgi:hypothetical protein